MTLTVLASVSLLVLVSSAHPFPKLDKNAQSLQLLSESDDGTDGQQAIQAVFESRGSLEEELVPNNDFQLHLAATQEIRTYLLNSENTAIRAEDITDPQTIRIPDEKELYDVHNKLEEELEVGKQVSYGALDTMSIKSSSEITSIDEVSEESSSVTSADDYTDVQTLPRDLFSSSVFVISISCLVAFFAVGCIATALYIIEVLRSSVFTSTVVTTWSLLPSILEKKVVTSSGQTGDIAFVTRDLITVSEKQSIPGALDVVEATIIIEVSEVKDLESGSVADADEKFFDAEWSIPEASTESPNLHFTVPTPILEPIYPLSSSNAVPEMREITLPDTEIELSRSSWQTRASEAGAIVRAPESQRETSNREGRRRGYFAVPELDAALAMQLRPGLGLGADAAWLVRFVMALFGWCAVLMSGATRRR